jgi:hypothetical protein
MKLLPVIEELTAVRSTLRNTFKYKRRGPGQLRTTGDSAIRAYDIRKFNPDPTNPKESTVTWRKLADLLFLINGKCPREIEDHTVDNTEPLPKGRKRRTTICGVSKHHNDHPCVKALKTAVERLTDAMKNDGIPI